MDNQKKWGIFGLVSLIIVAAIVFNMSYTSPFEKEIEYFEGRGCMMIDVSERVEIKTYEEYKAQYRAPSVTELSKDDFRLFVAEFKAINGFCKVWIDKKAHILWVGQLHTVENRQYIFWWGP